MEWYEIKCNARRSVKFPEKVLPTHNTSLNESCYENKLGGIIKKGEWAWLAKGSTLQIVSLKYGQTVSTFEFAESNGYGNCVVKCADELFPHNTEGVYLAVCLESLNSSGGSFIAIYSIDHSTVLSCMEVKLHVNCCKFMESNVCKRSLLQNFDGCLALGSMEGVIVLLDLNMTKILTLNAQHILEDVFIPCHIVDYSLPLREIHRNFQQCQQDGVHFGLQMEVIESPCAVMSVLPIDLILGIAIGLEDGRMVLYDLAELQIFYIAKPQAQYEGSPLVKMDFLEPPDDPRPCFYIWAVHENEENLIAILHSFMYEKRLVEPEMDNIGFFEAFQTSCVRLMLPLEYGKSMAVSCQSIIKSAVHGDEDSICLCALTWYSEVEKRNKLLLFDLNQWYKEEMPFMIDPSRNSNFLAAYSLNGDQCALESYIKPTTIAHFNSMQRFEEHFFPNSLSFDCSILLQDGSLFYNWEGAQNRFINALRSSTATIFLDPNSYFSEIIRTRLMPQFCELNVKSTFSTKAKYEVILSVALEYNCYSLLRDCAKCWVDGSFMGNISGSTGLTLSMLTDWTWKRATDIKTRVNDLCKGLFDYGGYPLDQREQKELGFISRQLKLLADLFGDILTFSKSHIPDKVYSGYEMKHKSLRMASDYQEILLWLLNIGLLPEASPYNCKVNPNAELVPYPYRQLKELYADKREFFNKIRENFVSKKTGSCRLLYIDAFIEHECKGNVLREYWLENNGDGLYPPPSIESMLRVMLVPDVSFDSKCAILLYFFLDLNMAINDEAYKNVVANFIKFPSVFKLSASLIKTVQAFWNLDHGHFLPAVDEFISPFNKNQNYPQWILELLIETLLTQNAANLALRILEARSNLVSPVLKLQTLLSNDLISEAFHFARSRQDDSLLEQFFTCCLCNGKFGVIRDLALSEKEGQLVQDILKRSKSQNAEHLHFVYLLQKSKYIEAVSYMDDISKAKSIRSNLNNSTSNTPNLVLSAYNATMTPVTQGLTDVYFRIKNKIRKKETDNKSPVPLSCQLIKQNANNLLGGIYHSSALSAHFATYYYGGIDNNKQDEASSSLLSSNNAPFLRKPQMETNFLDFAEKRNICYPQTYKIIEKRSLVESDLQEPSDIEKLSAQENPRKRRKILGTEVANDLSQLMHLKKNTSAFNTTDFNTTAAGSQSPVETTENFLTQPMPTNSKVQHDVIASNNTVKSLASNEIHGILKTNTPEPLERYSLRREVPMEEEKNIRFNLPSPEVENESSEEPPPRNIEVSVAEPKKRIKIVTRSLSVESSESSASSKAVSEDNFYSPLSSQNTSLVVDNPRPNDSGTMRISSIGRHHFADGPKARKPLARLSAEKSASPEPVKKLQSDNFQTAKSESKLNVETTIKSFASEDHYKTAVSASKLNVDSTIKSFVSADHFKTAETGTKLFVESSVKSFELEDDGPIAADVGSKTSSGFGSLDNRSAASVFRGNTEDSGTVSLSGSNIKEFVPKVSSSKVCETQSKFLQPKSDAEPKISDYSTVIGSISYVDSTSESSHAFRRFVPSVPEKPKPSARLPAEELDTTLGMSSYDFTVLDSTSLQQTKSMLQRNENEAEVAQETKDDEDEAMETDLQEEEERREETDIYAGLDNETKTDSEESNMLFDEAMGLHENLVAQNSSSSSSDIVCKEITPAPVKKRKNLTEAVIVLSSSDEESDNAQSESDDDDDSEDDKSTVSYDREYRSKHKKDIDDDSSSSSNDALLVQDPASSSDDDEDDDDDGGYMQENSDEEYLSHENKDKYLVEEPEEEEAEEEIRVEDDVQFEDNEKDNVEQPVEELYAEELEPELLNSEDDDFNSNQIDNYEGQKTTQESDRLRVDSENSSSNSNSKENNEVTSSNFELKVDESEEMVAASEDLPEKLLQENNEEQPTSSGVVQDVEEEPESAEPSFADNYELKVSESEDAEISSILEKVEEKKKEMDVEASGEMDNDEMRLRVEEDDVMEAQVEVEEREQVEDKASPVEDEMEKSDEMEVPDDSIVEHKQLEGQTKETNDLEEEEKAESTNSNVGSATEEKEAKLNEENEATMDESSEKQEEESIAKQKEESIAQQKKEATTMESKSNVESVTADVSLKEDGEKKSSESPPIEHVLEEAVSSIALDQRSSRGTSVPPSVTAVGGGDGVSTPKRKHTRGVSVPPAQSLIDEEGEGSGSLTPRTRRSSRAGSVQPKSIVQEESLENRTPTRMRRSIRGSSVPHSNAKEDQTSPTSSYNLRGTSVPPAEVPAKISGRRRSTLLDAINEDPSTLDSPSTRTRSRARLNSMDSELDTSSVVGELPPQAKRTRKSSVSSSVSELTTITTTTPKRTRRTSVSSQAEAGAAKPPRARSVVSIQSEAAEAETESTGRRTPKRNPIKRKRSTDEQANDSIMEEETTKSEEHNESFDSIDSKQQNISPTTSSMLYSSSRRLTRTQLAMMEKSASLAGVSMRELEGSNSPVPAKRVTKRRTSRSTAASHQDSDDAESVASHMSNFSSPATRRRVTRSSVKDKDEVDEDLISVASSVGSEKHGKRRSKDSKGSPSTLLSAIPEDEADGGEHQVHRVEPKKRGRRAKP